MLTILLSPVIIEKKGQSYLDVAEEHGFLGKIFDIVSKVVNTNKDKM